MRWSIDFESVDTDDDALARVNGALVQVGLFIQLAAQPAGLQRPESSTLLLDLGEVGPGLCFEVVGEPLYEVRPSERIGRTCDAGFEGEDLLRAKGDPNGVVRRELWSSRTLA